MPAGTRLPRRDDFNGSSGLYQCAVQYFDLYGGASAYELSVNGQPVAAWKADSDLPADAMNGHTAVRFVVPGVPLRPKDVVAISARSSGKEPAPLDYLEITPDERAR